MKRAALFIGINSYKAPLRELSCAREDAAALYQIFLKEYSSDLVHFLADPNSDDMIDKIKYIMSNLDPGDLFLIYFSGHGVEIQNNHLLLSAQAECLAGQWRHAVSIDILKELTKKSGVQTVFILDSCREHTFEGTRSAGGAVQSRSVTMKRLVDHTDNNFLPPVIFCSCSGGEMAFEVKDLQHGIFTLALLDTLKDCAYATMDDITHNVAVRINSLLAVYHPGSQQTPEVIKSPLVNPVIWGSAEAKTAAAIPSSPQPVQEVVIPESHRPQSNEMPEANRKNCCELGKNGTVLLKCPADYNGICYIPAGVTLIGENAFAECASLTGVMIPETVTGIGDGAFDGCRNLSTLTLPSGVVTIGACAFKDCINLNVVRFHENVESIGVRAFEGCIRLSRIAIPESVTAIGSHAFSGCDNLTDVTIPEQFYTQLDSIFGSCAQLKTVNGKTVERDTFGKIRLV